MGTVKAWISRNLDPWFNLAAEDRIFRIMDPDDRMLMLYRNRESVVIGRFQNPWLECDVSRMDKEKVLLARRQSGGGTVFHDPGNTNFTFFSGIEDFDRKTNSEIIIRALGNLGIKAEFSERWDILIGGKKISGSAFKLRKDRAFHHGTLLIDSDLERLSMFLHPPCREIETKSVGSVRSEVANLTDWMEELNHSCICRAVVEVFGEMSVHSCEVEYIDESEFYDDPLFEKYYREISGWNWLYGKTPKFKEIIKLTEETASQLSLSPGKLILDIRNGVVNTVRVDWENPEKNDPDMLDEIGKMLSSLEGVKFIRQDMEYALDEYLKDLPEQKNPEMETLKNFSEFIADGI